MKRVKAIYDRIEEGVAVIFAEDGTKYGIDITLKSMHGLKPGDRLFLVVFDSCELCHVRKDYWGTVYAKAKLWSSKKGK